MKLRFTVEFEVVNDWDQFARWGNSGDGRKEVVGNRLRLATAQAVMTTSMRYTVENGITVVGVTVSEPEWDGWDNARIANEMMGGER